MKALLITVGLIAAFSLSAADPAGQRKQLTPEQKELRKAMMEKYDANKDKKLDKDELAKISAEDKAKMEKAEIWPKQGQRGQQKKQTK